VSVTVCLRGQILGYPEGGGHAWAYLNWALGLRSVGCQVLWLELVPADEHAGRRIAALGERLQRYGFEGQIALVNEDGTRCTHPAAEGYLDLDAAAEADVLLNVGYELDRAILARFRRTALLDIDPGLTQSWLANGWIEVPRHDIYLTIGETVGQPDALFPDAGLDWHYVAPGASLDVWPRAEGPPARPFTTVTTWAETGQWIEVDGEIEGNNKRDGFLPYLHLPSLTDEPLELALTIDPEEGPPTELIERGWHVVDAWEVARMPWDYAEYVRSSRAEFSCAKPSCARFQNAWMSDRTVCYLASGRPAVVEHSGPSRFLPDAEGLFRFCSPAEAVAHLEAVASDYDRQSALARELAEEYFDARKNAARALELALAVPAR
jgi:hypothetical protein